MCMGREIRQDTHVIVEMIFSLGGYHSSPRDAHAHKIDHIFARSAPRVPHRTAPNEMPKLLCMQNSRLFPQTHDTQHGAVQHVPFQSNATYALDKFLTIISTYTVLHMFRHLLFWAGNQGNYQHLDPSLLPKKL